LLERFLTKAGVTPEDYANAVERTLALLQDQNLSTSQIKKALSPLKPAVEHVFSQLLSRMESEGLLIHGRTRGSWKSGQSEWAALENWLPGFDLDALSPEEARCELARRYFSSYGPASAADLRWWSGFSANETAETLKGLEAELASVQVAGLPGEYFLLQADLEALLAAPGEHPWQDGPRLSLLPVWDAYMMAYRERARILDRARYDRVYDRSGNCAPVILLDGRAAGVWDLEEEPGAITVKAAFFEAPPAEVWEALRQAADRLAAALRNAAGRRSPSAGEEKAVLLRCAPPPSLAGASQNRFHFPLRELPGEPV
jgi:hypothetical protein